MTRLPFFPAPEAGESLWSPFSRCEEIYGVPSTDLTSFFTGQPYHIPLTEVLPTKLAAIADRVPLGHPWADVNCMIRDHTLLPYYTFFCVPSVQSAVDEFLRRNADVRLIHRLLGLSQSVDHIGLRRVLWCSECSREDLAMCGFSYYHREHQLPGVLVCWKHHCVLNQGCRVCGSRPVPGRILMPGRCLCPQTKDALPVIAAIPGNAEAAVWIAEQSAYLLNARLVHQCPREVLTDLFPRAEFGGRWGHLMYLKVAIALEERYGEDFLHWLGYDAFDAAGHPRVWLKRALRSNSRKLQSPTLPLLLLTGLVLPSVSALEES